MSLTRNIVGCWSPSLGATGYLLRDVSGLNNHGTLTNMDPGTDWVASENGLVLDFDGVNDQVSTTARLPTAISRTVSVWANPAALDRSQQWAFAGGVGQFNQAIVLGFYGGNQVWLSQWGANVQGPRLTVNRWYMLSASHTGNNWRLFVDGVLVNAGPMPTTSAAHPIFIGSGGGIYYWCGQISETAVWSRQLADPEIAELYRRGNGWLGRELTGMNQRRTYGKKLGNRRRRLLCGGMI